MTDRRTLATDCGLLSECPPVMTDGETAFVVGIPVQLPSGVGPDEAAVALPLAAVLRAAAAHRPPRRWESDAVVAVVAILTILLLGAGVFVLLWRIA